MPGQRLGPFDLTIGPELIRRFADATDDSNPYYREGSVVPPTAPASLIYKAQFAAFEQLIPFRVLSSAAGGVHGEHDIMLHRLVIPGEPLRTFVEVHGARPARSNTRIALRHLSLDSAGHLVLEQWWTTVLIGVSHPSIGDDVPGHTFPGQARERPLGEYVMNVDQDMASRYAQMSGDFSAHHFDLAAARKSGFDRVFLHGLCTMGLCTRAVVERAAGGDPRRVRRVAVRFATPIFPPAALQVDLYDADLGVVAFEATSGGAKVITNGRAELVPDNSGRPRD